MAPTSAIKISGFVELIVNYFISHGLIRDDILLDMLVYSSLSLILVIFITFLLSWISFVLIESVFKPNLYNYRERGFVAVPNIRVYSTVLLLIVVIMLVSIYCQWSTIGEQYKKDHRISSMLKEYLSSQYYRTSQYSYNSNKEIGMVMQSLNIYPGNFIARCKLGEIYALKRDYNAAVREYRLAMNTNPQYADTYFEIAKILPQNDAIIEVEKGLQLANNYTEESVNTIQTVSSILMRQGKAEDAISMLKNVYKLNQGYYEVDINIGNNLAQLGRYYEAIKHYNYVLRVSQQYSGNAYLGLGNVYNKIDNYLEAIRYYQLALSNEKDAKSMICFLARFNLGNILLDYNHIDEAIEQFNYLLNINRQMTVEYFVKYGVSEKIYEKTGRRLEWQYMHMYNNNTIDLTGAIR